MVVDRRGFRRCAWRLIGLHLSLRAVWSLARQGGGWQLLHQVGALAAWSHAWRAGQSRGHFVGIDRRHFGQFDRQRRDHRYVHDPIDEARRLPGAQGGVFRDGSLGQWTDHAAGDGRCRFPDGRIRRYSLRAGDQTRGAASDHFLYRSLLHRAP